MTKGYKATYNYKCLDQIYEVGQEYKLDQKPVICKSGFHYCVNAKHTLLYYIYSKDFKLLEIEDLSNDTIVKDDKSCSNYIKVIREINNKEELLQLLGCYSTYDENEKIFTYKDSKGYWYESTYNENGKELTYKNSSGYWYEHTYDESGNQLTYKNSDGYWSKSTYNADGYQLTYRSKIMILK